MILFINGLNYAKKNLTSLPKINKSNKKNKRKRKKKFLLGIDTMINS